MLGTGGIQIVKQDNFSPWVQKVMPGVYDDTLTYYELLAKVIAYMNQMNDQQNEIIDWMHSTVDGQNKDIEMLKKSYITFRGDMVREFEKFKNDVTNTLLGEKVGEILEAWYEDGKLAEIINKDVFDMKADKEDLNKLEQYVYDIGTSVRKFGAKGDGSTNDKKAFDDTQANSMTTIIPRGTFLIDGDLELTRPIKGSGDGSVIIIKNGRIQVKENGVSISNLKIISQMNNPINIHGESVDKRLEDVKVHDITVEHAETVAGNFMGIDVINTDRLHIYNNRFTKGGLQLVQARDYMIHDNTFDGMNANDNELIHASTHSNGQITTNLFLNSNTDAIDMYTSGARSVVSGNRFRNINMGSGKAGTVIEMKITLRDAPFEGGSSDQPQYGSMESNVISGNIIHDMKVTANGRYTAIGVTYIDFRATKSYDPSKAGRHVAITGNIIEGFNINGSSDLTGIYFNAIAFHGINATIDGNIIRNIKTHGAPNWDTCGIKLGLKSGSDEYTAMGVTVSNNMIATEASGIVIESAKGCTITGNTMRDDNFAGTQLRYGVYIGTTSINNVISDNTIDCGQSGSNGLYSLPTAVVSRCVFDANVIVKSVANTLPLLEKSTISNNVFNSSITIGGTAVKESNKFVGNHFELANAYGIITDNQKGMVIQGNTFQKADHGILIQNKSTYGAIVGNTSTGQSGATVIRYLAVEDPDKATFQDVANILVK